MVILWHFEVVLVTPCHNHMTLEKCACGPLLSLNHLCKSTTCSISAGLIFPLFVLEFLPIIVHLPSHGPHIFISMFSVDKLLL